MFKTFEISLSDHYNSPVNRAVKILWLQKYWPIFDLWLGKVPPLNFWKICISLREVYLEANHLPLRQQKFRFKYLSKKMLYGDDSPLYEIFCWSRSFLNRLRFNFLPLFADICIFYIFTRAKTFSATKSEMKAISPYMKSSGKLVSYQVLLVLIV